MTSHLKTAERHIEYLPLAAIKPATKNPKAHDIGEITHSYKRNGFGEPPLLDERTGRLVAGHGRIETLVFLKKQGGDPPEGLRVDRGEWLVPVVRGWASKSDADAAAYLIGSNRLSELGGWDDPERDAMLVELSKLGEDALLGTGYDADDVDRILRDALPANADDVPPIPDTSWVKRGDLFRLGEHRLLCGSSTESEDVVRLMGDERAALMNTDPPYGVSYNPADRKSTPQAKAAVAKQAIANDDLAEPELEAFLVHAFVAAVEHALSPAAAWYVWHAGLKAHCFHEAIAAAGAKVRHQIIWVKPALILGRGHYHWQHEPCFMGWGKAQPPDFGRGANERDQTTVWQIPGVPVGERKELGHATPKPVALFEIPLVKHLKVHEICYEPFAGTGPQLIAAEHLNRKCYAMELEPRYVQTILDRWSKFTGRKWEQLK